MNERPLIALLVPPARLSATFTEEALVRLRGLGQLVRGDGTTEDIAADLPELLAGAAIAVTSWGSPPIPEELFSPNLRLVVHAAGSVKRLIPQSVVERGVIVSHAANIIAEAVSEYAICLILMGLRRPHEMNDALRGGSNWTDARTSFGEPRLLAGRQVGVVSAGYVGRKVVGLLRAFGAHVSVYDPYLAEEGARGLGVKRSDLDSLMASSEILTVHAPITPDTRHMIGAAHLAKLRDGALFINVGRSWAVDQDALLKELQAGRFWAALDVFDQEPLPIESPFRSLPNALITPHQAGHALDTYRRQGEAMVDEIERMLRGEPLQHSIRPEAFALMA